MINVIDHPRQWVEVKHESARQLPWVVIVSGYVRAECSTKAEADNVRAAIFHAFLKGQRTAAASPTPPRTTPAAAPGSRSR